MPRKELDYPKELCFLLFYISVDPILDGTEYDLSEYVYEVVNFTAYLYVRNNPLRWVDPLGLKIADPASYTYLDGNGGGSKNEIVDPKPSMSEADKYNIPTNITPDIIAAVANEQDKVRVMTTSAGVAVMPGFKDTAIDGGIGAAGAAGGGMLGVAGTFFLFDILGRIFQNIGDTFTAPKNYDTALPDKQYADQFGCSDSEGQDAEDLPVPTVSDTTGESMTGGPKKDDDDDQKKLQLKKMSKQQAEQAAKQNGYKNAEEFKNDFAPGNGARFNMKYDPKTGAIYLESIRDGKQIPTNLLFQR